VRNPYIPDKGLSLRKRLFTSPGYTGYPGIYKAMKTNDNIRTGEKRSGSPGYTGGKWDRNKLSVPTDKGSVPTDKGSVPTDKGSVPTDKGSA